MRLKFTENRWFYLPFAPLFVWNIQGMDEFSKIRQIGPHAHGRALIWSSLRVRIT